MTTTTLLQNLTDQTTLILQEVESDFADLPQNILNTRPGGNGWSVLECFEHLNRYNQYYLTEIETAIQKNRIPAKAVELKTTWIGKKSIEMMHPSNRKKQTTFKRMDPANRKLSIGGLTQFTNDQQRLLSLFRQASRVDINAKLVPLEFFKIVKMTIAEALEFVVVHEQRHLLQAREALTTILVPVK